MKEALLLLIRVVATSCVIVIIIAVAAEICEGILPLWLKIILCVIYLALPWIIALVWDGE